MLKKNVFVAVPLAILAVAIAVFFAWQARRNAGFQETPMTSTDASVDPVTGAPEPGGSGVGVAGGTNPTAPEGDSAGTGAIDNAGNTAEGALVSGTIEVTPELADRSKQIGIVFVMLRSAAGGPPYAVSRIENPRTGAALPFSLTSVNVMTPGVPMPADARLVVRFDADGSAGPEAPGDLVGETNVDELGKTNLSVLVNREGGRTAQ